MVPSQLASVLAGLPGGLCTDFRGYPFHVKRATILLGVSGLAIGLSERAPPIHACIHDERRRKVEVDERVAATYSGFFTERGAECYNIYGRIGEDSNAEFAS